MSNRTKRRAAGAAAAGVVALVLWAGWSTALPRTPLPTAILVGTYDGAMVVDCMTGHRVTYALEDRAGQNIGMPCFDVTQDYFAYWSPRDRMVCRWRAEGKAEWFAVPVPVDRMVTGLVLGGERLCLNLLRPPGVLLVDAQADPPSHLVVGALEARWNGGDWIFRTTAGLRMGVTSDNVISATSVGDVPRYGDWDIARDGSGALAAAHGRHLLATTPSGKHHAKLPLLRAAGVICWSRGGDWLGVEAMFPIAVQGSELWCWKPGLRPRRVLRGGPLFRPIISYTAEIRRLCERIPEMAVPSGSAE